MAIKAFGSTVTVGGTNIGGLVSCPTSGGDVPTFDVTTQASTGREFVSGLADHGTLELTGFLDFADAGQDALRAGTGTSAEFVITLPNTKTISFSALIGIMNEDVPLEGGVGFSCSCKITGPKTYAS